MRSVPDVSDVRIEEPTGYTPSQRVLAEFVGTFTVVFVAAGSVVAARAGDGGLVTIALAPAFAVAAMILAVGHISGAHFNPAVTVAAWVTGRISTAMGAIYIWTQLLGASAAALVLRVAVPEDRWKPVKLGAALLSDEVSTGQGLLIEAVLTFFLVWVIFATVIDADGDIGKLAGLAIGLVIAMDIMVGGPLSGAAMNPARSFGPALAGGYWDKELVFWIGPILGAVVAAVAYDVMYLRRRRPVQT